MKSVKPTHGHPPRGSQARTNSPRDPVPRTRRCTEVSVRPALLHRLDHKQSDFASGFPLMHIRSTARHDRARN